MKKKSIPFPEFSKGLKKGFFYEGGLIALTPYENSNSWGFIQAPENSILFDERNKSSHQSLDSNSNFLIAGAQGTNQISRMIVTGSFRLFSNELVNRSEGDNLALAANILDWIQFKSQVFSISYFSVCLNDSINCENKNTFEPH